MYTSVISTINELFNLINPLPGLESAVFVENVYGVLIVVFVGNIVEDMLNVLFK